MDQLIIKFNTIIAYIRNFNPSRRTRQKSIAGTQLTIRFFKIESALSFTIWKTIKVNIKFYIQLLYQPVIPSI